LVNFYNTVCGDDCALNWNFDTPVAGWEGVVVAGDRVAGIQVLSKGLSGQLPDLNLPELTDLYLQNNKLNGAIPDFSGLPKLEKLYLNGNQLSDCWN